jgi:hypothetical protein
MGEQRIVVEFREKGRGSRGSEYMPDAEAEREYERVVKAWEEGPNDERIIRVGKQLMVRASDIANLFLEPSLGGIAFDFGPDRESIWNKKF